MLVLRLLPNRIWDIEFVEGHNTASLKKVRTAQTVDALIQGTDQTTDYFYQALRTAARFGQPIWVNMADVCTMKSATVGLLAAVGG
jgi:hypothetical protein